MERDPETAKSWQDLCLTIIISAHRAIVSAGEFPRVRLSENDLGRAPVCSPENGVSPQNSPLGDPALLKRFRWSAQILGGATIVLGTLTLAMIPVFLSAVRAD